MIHSEGKTPAQVVTAMMEVQKSKPDSLWDIKEHKEKRSLSQNGYYWQLITEVARKKKQSVPYTHNYELRAARYAKWIEGEAVEVQIPDTDEAEAQVMEQVDYHLCPTNRRVGDKRVYILLRGSSTMNTAEMSHLLDCLIQDAQALGISTKTPDELARMRMYEQEKEDARANKGKPDQ